MASLALTSELLNRLSALRNTYGSYHHVPDVRQRRGSREIYGALLVDEMVRLPDGTAARRRLYYLRDAEELLLVVDQDTNVPDIKKSTHTHLSLAVILGALAGPAALPDLLRSALASMQQEAPATTPTGALFYSMLTADAPADLTLLANAMVDTAPTIPAHDAGFGNLPVHGGAQSATEPSDDPELVFAAASASDEGDDDDITFDEDTAARPF